MNSPIPKNHRRIAASLALAIQACTNLVDWTAVNNFVSATASNQFTDTTAPNLSRRFYRAVTP